MNFDSNCLPTSVRMEREKENSRAKTKANVKSARRGTRVFEFAQFCDCETRKIYYYWVSWTLFGISTAARIL